MATHLGAALFAAFILASVPLLADVLPPEAQACWGAQVGDACDGGTCKDGTCTRLNYDQAGGPPHGTVDYDCVKCVENSGSGGATDAGAAGAPDAAAGATGGTPPIVVGCSCRLSADRDNGHVGIQVLGASALLLLALRRRRQPPRRRCPN
jgi:hypothetical protein